MTRWRWYLTFALPRAAAVLFAFLTSAYAVATYSPFVFHLFILPRVFAPVNQFVAWHHLIYLGVYALVVLSLIPDLRHPRTKRPAQAFVVVFGILGEWLFMHPYLPRLWNGPNCLVVAIGAYVPLVALAAVDHWAAWPDLRSALAASKATAQRRLLFACGAAAAWSWLVYLARAGAREWMQPTMASVVAWMFAMLWSFALHALAFMALYVLAGIVTTVAVSTRREALVEYALSVVAVASLIAVVLLRLVLPTISFSEQWGLPIALAAGVAIAVSWSGLAARTPRPAQQAAPMAIDLLAAPVSPRGTAGAVVLLVAVPIAAFLLLQRVEKFDWNSLGQKLVVLGGWTVTFVAWLAAFRSAGDGRRSVVRAVVPSAVSLAAALALAFATGRSDRWTSNPWLKDQTALDRYAAVDPSFRLVREAVVSQPGADPQFFRFLQTNTHIPYWVPLEPPAVSFVSDRRQTSVRRPHIFLFVIDSLRRDYVGAYNPAATFTPGLDAFAAESLVFRNAFTRYGGTSMAVPSIWAGGLLMHRTFFPEFHKLNAIEKLLDLDGYRKWIGLDSIMGPLVTKSESLNELDRGRGVMQFDLCTTLSELEDRLANDRDPRPVFAYSLPQTLHISLVFKSSVPNGESYPGFFGPYASRLRRIDGCFGNFISFMKRAGLYDDSIIAVTSDHGDSFGEDGNWGHIGLFPEVSRIPLILHLPSWLQSTVSADLGAIAFSTDIAPTLYELADHHPVAPNGIFGTPLVSRSAERLDADRRRRPYLMVASYAPTYAMLRHNGRSLYIVDLLNGREYGFDLTSGLLGRRVRVTDADRALNRRIIREQVTELDRFYHYTPRPWNER